MRLLCATRNPDKVGELREALRALPVALLSLDDLPPLPEVAETGDTLEENALLKARSAYRASGEASLADDTGLEVDALGGRPGVRSARYAGPGADYERNVTKLLREMEGIPPERRGARFRTVIAVLLPDGSEHLAHGSCVGRILDARRGSGGFGYDPVFWVPEVGRTFAEMGLAEKNRISHRGRAVRAARQVLVDYLAAHRGANPEN
ncbi:MAG: RdgB/HAM1 family non-canonical purine NTP pyrophosphatase [Candidatus Eisenbacteria bacterium]|nr:RdgB/HAM1 family non-canonical purine NTP pyrophosphatase [Candidatus Eisenbacteria bacterium]